MSAKPDDAFVCSDASSVIIIAQDPGGSSTIDPNFLLLNSQSTVNLFSNPTHVDNVCPATHPIQVHCNKGVMSANNVADFGSNEVYVNKDGIANVLSLFLLGKKHHITYDSHNHGGVFKVHTSEGLIEFKPTSKGLHALNLRAQPEAAHLLVTSSHISSTTSDNTPPPMPPAPENNHLHVVKTVRENYEGFTKKQVQHTNEVRHIMLMMGVPTERTFKSMVRLNQLQDCPINIDDVKNAHLIWGNDLGGPSTESLIV